MNKILGYGEDAFTLWAIKNRIPNILQHFRDPTAPSDCLIFYRPSFGRSGGKNSAEFGEFDAIFGSLENIYLIESKWDNFSKLSKEEITLRTEQKMRHRVFSWYLTNWNKRYSNNWKGFLKEHTDDFKERFPENRIAPAGSILSTNLEFILTTLQNHCKKFSSKHNIKNVLLFFYNQKRTKLPTMIGKEFDMLGIDYSQEITGNFVTLD